MKIGSYAKSIVGAVVAGGGMLAAAMDDNVVTYGEWLGVAIAALGALGIVAAVPNARVSDDLRR